MQRPSPGSLAYIGLLSFVALSSVDLRLAQADEGTAQQASRPEVTFKITKLPASSPVASARKTQVMARSGEGQYQLAAFQQPQDSPALVPPAVTPPGVPSASPLPEAGDSVPGSLVAPPTSSGSVPQTNSGVTNVPPPAANREDSLAPLQNRELTNKVSPVNISLDGIGTGELPEDSPLSDSGSMYGLPTGFERAAAFKCVHWQPSLICHNPLYFEDTMLERHGHVRFGYLQPLASGAKFFGTLPLMPYLYTLKPSYECQYALGQYRAGSCAPLLRDQLPWDARAAVVESASVASFFWAAPL